MNEPILRHLYYVILKITLDWFQKFHQGCLKWFSHHNIQVWQQSSQHPYHSIASSLISTYSPIMRKCISLAKILKLVHKLIHPIQIPLRTNLRSVDAYEAPPLPNHYHTFVGYEHDFNMPRHMSDTSLNMSRCTVNMETKGKQEGQGLKMMGRDLET